MTDPWNEIMTRLEVRDKVNKQDSEYYRAFDHLSRLVTLSGDPNTDRLVKENAHLWEENEGLIARLNSQTLRLETAESHAKELEKFIKAKEAHAKKMESKIELLTQQIIEKNKSLEIINDEHLISQIQQNVLKDRMSQLESELATFKIIK